MQRPLDNAITTEPTWLASKVFRLKASLLILRRGFANWAEGVSRFPIEAEGSYTITVAESRTPLWTETSIAELPLQRGKVQNLRCALRRLNGAVIPAGQVFSFWGQIGRATRSKGYVDGRQLQEGCLIPAIGGGICQLSNALYDVALRAGCEIVERHPHTRIVPGSAAEQDHDATVAWNYIDLRFRSEFTLRIEARMTSDTLIVRLCSDRPTPRAHQKPASNFITLMSFRASQARPHLEKHHRAQRALIDVQAHSCHTCGMEACFRHRNLAVKPIALSKGRTAFLVDEKTPELARYLADAHRPEDVLAIPLDGERWKRPQYAWEQDGYAHVVTAAWQTLARAFAARRLGRYGAARLQAQLNGAEALAQAFARSLSSDVTHLCVSQTLLPYLWRDGHLGGRTFDVLMGRLPLATLHQRLDSAVHAYPDRRTLAEFRAPQWLVDKEAEALAAADRIITPHSEIAALFPGQAVKLDWSLPDVPSTKRGVSIAFPGPTAARKGAYELREVARECDLEVVLIGSELEGEDFWSGVRTRRVARDTSGRWLEGVAAVVQPALVEERPRLLLTALAAGVPVVASPACGLDGLTNVISTPFGDQVSLKEAIRQGLLLSAAIDLHPVWQVSS